MLEIFFSHGGRGSGSKMEDHLDNSAMSGGVKVEVANTSEGPTVI